MALRLIQAGLGGWGKNWYEHVVKKYRGVKLVGCVERVEAAREGAVEAMGLPSGMFHRTLRDALRRVDADAVLITANLPGHGPLARQALEAGLHVLVEKPFVPTVREGLGLAALARQRKRLLMVSQNYRFNPAVRAVQRLVRSGTLGPVTTAHIDFRMYSNDGDPKRKHYHITEPLLLDMAVHQMDLLRAVLGCEATEVVCRPTNPAWSQFVQPPAASALITFRGGIVASYRGSWIAHHSRTSWAGQWTVECRKGAIVWSSRGIGGEQVRLFRKGEPEGKAVALPRLRYTDRGGALDEFVRAVRSGRQPETSARDNVNTLRLVYGTIAASRSHRTVTL